MKEKVWNFVEQLKTIAELLVALIFLAPILLSIWKIIEQGVNVVLPAWLIVLSTIFGILFGYFLGRGYHLSKNRWLRGKAYERINFNYFDTPIEHGWILSDGQKPSFISVQNRFYNQVMKITSPDWYGIDYYIKEENSQKCRNVEFVLRYETDGCFYINVVVESERDKQQKSVWFKCGIGTDKPIPVNNGTKEWAILLSPTQNQNDLFTFNANLREIVNKTFGNDGWKFHSLKRFRLRGNLTIAYVEAY